MNQLLPLPELVYAKLRHPLSITSKPRPALFLDRDGVINEDVGYLYRIEELVICPGISDRIADARKAGYQTVIVTNQSGIGRGYYDWQAFETLQEEIESRLRAENPRAEISMTCACPFHPNAQIPYAATNHPWRKPQPGMLLYASKKLSLDLTASLMIGDSKSDELAARRCGVRFEYAIKVKG